jgi:hypothetical protein
VALPAAQHKTLRFMDGTSLYLHKKNSLAPVLCRAQSQRKIVLLRRLCAFHFFVGIHIFFSPKQKIAESEFPVQSHL